MRLAALPSALLLLLSACTGLVDDGSAPANGITEFSSSFDGVAGDIDALFPPDASGWTNMQQLGHDDNVVDLVDTKSRSIAYSLYARAEPNDDPVSKADIVKGGLFFREGDEIWIQVAVYVLSDPSPVELFLLDIESTMYNGDPGRRIHVRSDGTLRVESKGEFHGPSLSQDDPPIPLPTDEWVELVLALDLSASDDGRIRLWQNSDLLIDERARTLKESRSVLDRLQIGLTANPSGDTMEAWFDDVVVTTTPLR